MILILNSNGNEDTIDSGSGCTYGAMRSIHDYGTPIGLDESSPYKRVKLAPRTRKKIVGIKKDTGDIIVNEVQEDFTILMSKSNENGNSVNAISDQPYAPIRIFPLTADLYNDSQYCTATSKTAPTFQGTIAKCTPDSVLTDEKRNVLLNMYLPTIFQYISQVLSVVPLTKNINVTGTPCKIQTLLPEFDRNGVSGSDVALFVSAGPSSNSQTVAGQCSITLDGRPLILFINYAPETLDWNTLTARLKKLYIRRGLHVLVHTLGISLEYIKSEFFLQNKISPAIGYEMRLGVNTTIYKGKFGLKAAREYFNCSNLTGVPFENEGSGVNDWERRYFFQELLIANPDIYSLQAFSNITLGVFEDSGHYKVNYSMSESMHWGQNSGCSIFSNTCNTTAGGLNDLFCINSSDTCSFDNLGIGKCATLQFTSIPPYWQYFSNPQTGGRVIDMDYCPVIIPYNDQNCNDPKLISNSVMGQFYGTNSICVKTSSNVIQKGRSSNSGFLQSTSARCLETRCNNKMVELRIGTNQKWIPCDPPNSTVDLSKYGYEGNLSCPPVYAACKDARYFDINATDAPTTVTTVPERIISGSSSSSLTGLAFIVSIAIIGGIVLLLIVWRVFLSLRSLKKIHDVDQEIEENDEF